MSRPVTAAEFEELTGIVPESRIVRGRRMWMCEPPAGQVSAELAYRRLIAAGVEAFLAVVVVAAVASDPEPATTRLAEQVSGR